MVPYKYMVVGYMETSTNKRSVTYDFEDIRDATDCYDRLVNDGYDCVMYRRLMFNYERL